MTNEQKCNPEDSKIRARTLQQRCKVRAGEGSGENSEQNDDSTIQVEHPDKQITDRKSVVLLVRERNLCEMEKP